jgi:hypothetical protein
MTTEYTKAKSRGDTRGMHAAYLKARAEIHVRLAKEARYGRTRMNRVKAAVSA